MRQGVGSHLRRNLTVLAVVSAVYLVAAMFVTNSYYQLILTLVPVWALFGVSWNILSGYGGQLSFGHASFFGIGAYTVTLGLIYWNLSPWLGIPLGGLMGGLAAIVIGMPTFRLRGHYFALSMLAYPLAILLSGLLSRDDLAYVTAALRGRVQPGRERIDNATPRE